MATTTDIGKALARESRRLAKAVDALSFGEPVTHVYNPLVHARKPHERFLDLADSAFVEGTRDAIWLGMNPGPWGMAQTGVPFGDVTQVREYLGIDEPVRKPANEHPKRLVTGLDCPRNEVSGTRVYEFAREEYGDARSFFGRFFIVNYCPLSFMEESGRNRTPDKLPAEERAALFEVCDAALMRVVELLEPRMVIGIGKFAEDCARRVLGPHQVRLGLKFGRILHPSPASPLANRGWAPAAKKDLAACLAQLD